MIDIIKSKIEALDNEIQYCSERIAKAKEKKVIYEDLVKEVEVRKAEAQTLTCDDINATESVRILSYGE